MATTEETKSVCTRCDECAAIACDTFRTSFLKKNLCVCVVAMRMVFLSLDAACLGFRKLVSRFASLCHYTAAPTSYTYKASEARPATDDPAYHSKRTQPVHYIYSPVALLSVGSADFFMASLARLLASHCIASHHTCTALISRVHLLCSAAPGCSVPEHRQLDNLVKAPCTCTSTIFLRARLSSRWLGPGL